MSRLYGSYRSSIPIPTTKRRRESFDSTPSQVSSASASNRGSLSSSAILNQLSSLTSSFQRRFSGALSSSLSSSANDDETHHIPDSEPPLSPITLHGFSETTTERVLTDKLAEDIRLMMPMRLQVQDGWDLVYSLNQHGVSLATLYARCKAFNSPQAGFVVIVKDREGNIFGAYLSDYPHVYPHYYGTGECFLFKFIAIPHSPQLTSSYSSDLLISITEPTMPARENPSPSGFHSHSSVETSQSSVFSATNEPTRPPPSEGNDSSSLQYQIKGFSYTGLNDYMILCTPQFLSVGGG